MREVTGNLWDYYDHGAHVAITTNGSVTGQRLAVLGRGVAREAKQRFPQLPLQLGVALRPLIRKAIFGDVPLIYLEDLRLFAFPVKVYWKDPANPDLIMRSAERLMAEIDRLALPAVYTVRPGCGSGRLVWSRVKPLIDSIFDDRVTIVQR